MPSVSGLLLRHDLAPVLIDIGASGPHREIWQLVAAQSVLVRFDPDLRDILDLDGTGYRRAVTVNEAVTADSGAQEVPFYLTRSPYCSSTLRPDIASLSDYIYTDLFHVERQVHVKASTLESVLQRLSIDRLDWFKTDSQGTDLRLFNSIPKALRVRVLCVEVEPGILDAYQGEDHFVDVHRELKKQGFWLTEAKVCGTTRVRQSTLAHLKSTGAAVDAYEIGRKCAVTPGWVEATYLRDLRHLEQHKAPPGDYVVLWAFALMVRQWGFALDVALDYERLFGADQTSAAMAAPVTALLTRQEDRVYKSARRALKAVLPGPVVNWIKSIGA
jgi:hypothetical protein